MISCHFRIEYWETNLFSYVQAEYQDVSFQTNKTQTHERIQMCPEFFILDFSLFNISIFLVLDPQ